MPLVFDNISKTVSGETHIHPTDLRLAPGSFNTLLGRTRAGKTTLLRLMAGLDRPSGGRISMQGRDVTRLPVRRRSVAMVYQQFVNYPNFSVFDNIASPLKIAGIERSEIDRRVGEAAEMMHLGPFLERLPAELSGGQQQRVALARALVKEADLLLLDEPLVNLDFKLREELRVELRRLLAGSDAIVVYATAEPQESLALGGNAIIVDEGRVLQQGPAAEIYRRPQNVRTAQLMGDPPINVVEGLINETTMQFGMDEPVTAPDHLCALPDGPYLFGVRPNHVLMRRRAPSDIEIRTRVELAEISGSETSIHFSHGGSSWVSRQDGVHPLGVDEPIRVYIEPQRVFAFDSEGALIAAPDHLPAGGSA
jgi:glycerol transport system ATP-binding protein